MDCLAQEGLLPAPLETGFQIVFSILLPAAHMSSEKKPVVQDTSNAEFINLLCEQINSGGGFVPFIGSGCSSPSGILMGVQFDEYLSYTVFLCVAEIESIAEAEPMDRRWNLRSDGWPKQPTTEQVGIARKWIRRQFDRICDECGFRTLPEDDAEVQSLEPVSISHKPEDLAKALTCPLLPRILRSSVGGVDQETLKRLLPFFGSKGLERGGYSVPGISPTSEDAIIERAIRALYDWRATLNFLSELKLRRSQDLIGRRARAGSYRWLQCPYHSKPQTESDPQHALPPRRSGALPRDPYD
jgi:hypothetical protein